MILDMTFISFLLLYVYPFMEEQGQTKNVCDSLKGKAFNILECFNKKILTYRKLSYEIT